MCPVKRLLGEPLHPRRRRQRRRARRRRSTHHRPPRRPRAAAPARRHGRAVRRAIARAPPPTADRPTWSTPACGEHRRSPVGVPDEQGDLGGDDGDAGEQSSTSRARRRARWRVMPTARASGRRLAVGIHADDAGLVGGVGVGAVLRSRVARGGGASPTSSRRRARRAPARDQQQRGAGRVAADEPVERADRRRRSTVDARPQHHLEPHGAGSSPSAVGAPASAPTGRHASVVPGAATSGWFAPAQVEHRPLRADRRQPREVVRRRRRRRRPLQRVGVPRVGAGRRRLAQRPHDVDRRTARSTRTSTTMPIDEIMFQRSKSSVGS